MIVCLACETKRGVVNLGDSRRCRGAAVLVGRRVFPPMGCSSSMPEAAVIAGASEKMDAKPSSLKMSHDGDHVNDGDEADTCAVVLNPILAYEQAEAERKARRKEILKDKKRRKEEALSRSKEAELKRGQSSTDSEGMAEAEEEGADATLSRTKSKFRVSTRLEEGWSSAKDFFRKSTSQRAEPEEQETVAEEADVEPVAAVPAPPEADDPAAQQSPVVKSDAGQREDEHGGGTNGL